jgi:hypothetical protein
MSSVSSDTIPAECWYRIPVLCAAASGTPTPIIIRAKSASDVFLYVFTKSPRYSLNFVFIVSIEQRMAIVDKKGL